MTSENENVDTEAAVIQNETSPLLQASNNDTKKGRWKPPPGFIWIEVGMKIHNHEEVY